MENVSGAFPSHLNLFIYAKALAMNQKGDQASRLVSKLARMSTPEEYEQMKRVWQAQARNDASLAGVVWPDLPAPSPKP